MSTKHRIEVFSILAVFVLAAVTSGTIIAVGSVSAQNNSTEQQSSEAGSNGTTTLAATALVVQQLEPKSQ
jgi:hypothetical protein